MVDDAALVAHLGMGKRGEGASDKVGGTSGAHHTRGGCHVGRQHVSPVAHLRMDGGGEEV